MIEKSFYRIGELPQILALGKTTCYELVASGAIASVVIAGQRAKRVPAVALRKFIEEQENLALGQQDDRAS